MPITINRAWTTPGYTAHAAPDPERPERDAVKSHQQTGREKETIGFFG